MVVTETPVRSRPGAPRPTVQLPDFALAFVVGVIQVGGSYLASHHHQTPHRDWDVLAFVLLAAGPAALAFRRRAPVTVLAVSLGTLLIYWCIGYPRGPLWLSLIVAFFTAVVTGHRRAAIASLVAGFVGFSWLPPLFGTGTAPGLGAVLGLAAWLLVLFAVAEWFRVRGVRTQETEQVREAEAGRRISEERLRIARELHDVLAHNISLINVQAATTLYRSDRNEERAYDALAVIKQVSQETLVELRSLLGALREVDEAAPRAPAPSLTRLDELVASAAAAGVVARVEIDGVVRELPPSVDVAAYRILQEALTNVARHAGSGAADVRVVYGRDDLVVQVDDDGHARRPFVAGTGITGMRERAGALAGQLQAGPRADGGFRVRAWLPLADGS